MKYLLLLLLQLYGLSAATASSSIPPPARSKRRKGNGRVRGSGARRLDAGHANIFSFEKRDSPIKIQSFVGEARTAGLTFNARGMIKTKQQQQTGTKGGNRGSKDGSSGDALHLPAEEASEDVLNLPAKTSLLNKKMGKGNKQSEGKGSGMATGMHKAQSPMPGTTSDSGDERSGKSSKGNKAPSQSPKGAGKDDQKSPAPTTNGNGMGMGGSKVKTPSPTQYQTPPPTRKPSKGKYPTEKPSSLPSSKNKPSMGMGMGMGKGGKMTEAPAHMPVQQTPSPTAPMSCTVDSAGNVGYLVGDATLYDFFYQLEVVQGLSAEEVDDSLLKDVEAAMANALIPSLFPDQCGRQRHRRRRLQDTGSYVGFSTRPPDFVLNGCKFDVSR